MGNMISVVMPTYNTDIKILSEAVESILKQTYRDFEFIIIDDCSTNDTQRYLSELKDERIHVIKNKENMGITKSLNIGLRAAKGRYIARMDADDIALPERFEKQLNYMEEHPEVIVCGTWIQAFGAANYTQKRVIPDYNVHCVSMLFGNEYGLCHPTAFFRASTLREQEIFYDESLPTAQDYGMWVTCSEYGIIANVEEVLLNYRVHNGQISVNKRVLQTQCKHSTQRKVFFRAFPNSSEDVFLQHCQYCDTHVIEKGLFGWADWLIEENLKTGFFESHALTEYLDAQITQRVINSAKTDKNIQQILMNVKEINHQYMPLYIRTLLIRLIKKAGKVKK